MQIIQMLACISHQIVDATQCVIDFVEGVGQLIHAIIGFTVPIETHSYSRTVKRWNTFINKHNSFAVFHKYTVWDSYKPKNKVHH